MLALGFATSALAQAKVDTPRIGPPVAPRRNASEDTVLTYAGGVPAPITGALDADDSAYNRCVNCTTLSGVGTLVFYDTISITNTTAGTASFVVETSDQGAPGVRAPIDTFVTAYRPTFNPAAPLTNCVAFDDDAGPGNCSRMTLRCLRARRQSSW